MSSFAEDPSAQVDSQSQQGPPAESTEAPAPAPSPAQDEFRISRDEWEEFKKGQQLLGTAVSQLYGGYEQEEEVEEDYSSLSPGDLIQNYVDKRFGEILPDIQAFRVKEGQGTMKQIFSEAEKDPEVGSFDHDVAERAANYIFGQYPPQYQNDPRYAQHAAREGAKYAAEVRKREREEAIKEYKKSLQGGDHSGEPGFGAAGVPAPKQGETVDDVINRWAKAGTPTGTEEI